MFTVKESDIHEKGLFATEFIKKGAKIIDITGEKISEKEAIKREIENLDKGATYIFILNDEYSIDGEVSGNESRFINHSCEPNGEVDGNDDSLFVYALKDIEPHEEITIDYAFPQDEVISTTCECKSYNCRGFIEEN